MARARLRAAALGAIAEVLIMNEFQDTSHGLISVCLCWQYGGIWGRFELRCVLLVAPSRPPPDNWIVVSMKRC